MSGLLGDPDRSARAGSLARVAHLLPWAVAVLYPIRATADIAPGFLPWQLTLPSGFLILALFITAVFHQELGRICLRCMREVPADPGRRVAQTAPLLRMHHWPPRRYYQFWVPMYVAGTAATGLGGIGWSWVFLGCDTLFCATVIAHYVHHRLRPWCPQCRPWDDDGGPHEHIPTPDPSGVKGG